MHPPGSRIERNSLELHFCCHQPAINTHQTCEREADLHYNQSMRAMLNPPGERHEKKYVKSAVEALIPQEHNHARRWNVDVCDSVGLALTHLYRKGER